MSATVTTATATAVAAPPHHIVAVPAPSPVSTRARHPNEHPGFSSRTAKGKGRAALVLDVDWEAQAAKSSSFASSSAGRTSEIRYNDGQELDQADYEGGVATDDASSILTQQGFQFSDTGSTTVEPEPEIEDVTVMDDFQLAMLLQAQEAMSGEDLALVQDMIYAQLVSEHDRQQLTHDLELSRRLQALEVANQAAGLVQPPALAQVDVTGLPDLTAQLDLSELPLVRMGGRCTVCDEPLAIAGSSFWASRLRRGKLNGTNGADHDDDDDIDEDVEDDDERFHRAVFFPTCEHEYCAKCFARWIAATVTNRTLQFPTKCAVGSCEAIVTPDALPQRLADVDLAADFLRRYAAYTGDAIYCPARGCDAFLHMGDDYDKLATPCVRCYQCKTVICFPCRSVMHDDLTCAEFQALPDSEREPDDISLLSIAADHKWKRCQACRAIVERVAGCNYVMCHCGVGLCYECGLSYQSKVPTPGNVHGTPNCQCLLFLYDNVPAVAAPRARPLAPAQVVEVDQHGFDGELGNMRDQIANGVNQVAAMEAAALAAAVAAAVADDDQVAPRPIRGGLDAQRTDAGRRIPANGEPLIEIRHKMPVHLRQAYAANKCPYCSQSFASWGAFENHMFTTNSHSVFLCCKRTYPSAHALKQHIDDVHEGKSTSPYV